jgi:hypothetical protein
MSIHSNHETSQLRTWLLWINIGSWVNIFGLTQRTWCSLHRLSIRSSTWNLTRHLNIKRYNQYINAKWSTEYRLRTKEKFILTSFNSCSLPLHCSKLKAAEHVLKLNKKLSNIWEILLSYSSWENVNLNCKYAKLTEFESPKTV